jgi:hypothetical protein
VCTMYWAPVCVSSSSPVLTVKRGRCLHGDWAHGLGLGARSAPLGDRLQELLLGVSMPMNRQRRCRMATHTDPNQVRLTGKPVHAPAYRERTVR